MLILLNMFFKTGVPGWHQSLCYINCEVISSTFCLSLLPTRWSRAQWWCWRQQRAGGPWPRSWHGLGTLPWSRPIRKQHRRPGDRGESCVTVKSTWCSFFSWVLRFFDVRNVLKPSQTGGGIFVRLVAEMLRLTTWRNLGLILKVPDTFSWNIVEMTLRTGLSSKSNF